MSDDLVSRLKSPEVFISIGGMVSPVAHEAADRIEAQAAEITRLRAALATARREGMEEAAKIVVNAKDAIPWGTVEMGCERIAAAIRAAAKEGKP